MRTRSPPAGTAHAWLVCFKDQSDAINKKVCETRDLFDITGLPCVEGPDMGVVWDKPHKDDVALRLQQRRHRPLRHPAPLSRAGTTLCAWPRSSTDEMVKDGAVK